MNKYLNIIIISFFSFLLVKYDIGYPLLIPILITYFKKNSKLALIIIPVSLISTYFFNNELLKIIIIIYILLVSYLLVFVKKNNLVIDSIYVFVLTFISLVLKANEAINDNLYTFILYSIVSMVSFILITIILKASEINFAYFELVSIMIAILSSSLIEFKINICFVLSVFYTLYFTNGTNFIYSLIFASLMGVYINYKFGFVYSFSLPFLSIIYSLNSIISGFITVLFAFFFSFVLKDFEDTALIIGSNVIIFELFKTLILGKKITKKSEEKEETIEKKESLNTNVLAFANFLDMCALESTGTRTYYKKIDDGIKSMTSNYCNKCYLCNKCYQNDVKEEMKTLIINAKNITYDIKKSEVFSICPYNVEIRKSAILINEKLDNTLEKTKTKIISGTLNGVSNILRQFIIDNNIKKEMNYDKIYKLKKAISVNGYKITYFKVNKFIENDYLIEIGIRGKAFNDIKQNLEGLASKCLNEKVSIEYDYEENGKIYMRIIPSIKCKIEYSTSKVAKENVSGDNILINETKDGKILSIICDGMGKGYSANLSSEFVINMFEELFKSTLSSYAIIQMMNSYCEIKDSIDNFCTLDFLELDQKNCNMTFYKMSSAPSYIFRNNKSIERIDNKRLPLGKESEIILESIKVEEGDMIVMSSDGVFENIENQNELNEYILSIKHLPAPKIVYQIINFLKQSSKLTDDDISLIVLKVMPS